MTEFNFIRYAFNTLKHWSKSWRCLAVIWSFMLTQMRGVDIFGKALVSRSNVFSFGGHDLIVVNSMLSGKTCLWSIGPQHSRTKILEFCHKKIDSFSSTSVCRSDPIHRIIELFEALCASTHPPLLAACYLRAWSLICCLLIFNSMNPCSLGVSKTFIISSLFCLRFRLIYLVYSVRVTLPSRYMVSKYFIHSFENGEFERLRSSRPIMWPCMSRVHPLAS